MLERGDQESQGESPLMQITILLKSIGLWLLMMVAAVMNGLLRDLVLQQILGHRIALPLSGLTLMMLIFAISYFSVPGLRLVKVSQYLLLGVLWVGLTLVFEFTFGRYVADKSWQELWQVFNVTQGDLFALVLIFTALAPLLAARLRGLL